MIYSGAKAIEGPSAGLVVGKKEYIDWVRLQGKGIGRAMKIGKDNILGFTQAVEEYLAHGSESGASMQERLKPFVEAINNLSDLTAKIVQDGAGRDIYRASVKVDGRKTAKEVIQALKAESPAIYTREYQANNGIIEFDIRSVNSVENAQACYEAAEGHVVLGVLSKNYETDEAAIDDMKKYQAATNNALSVGLGAGDPNQSQMVARLSEVLQPQHVNQVFTGVGASRALLRQDETVINGLVSPTGKVGYVNIATGPLSSGGTYRNRHQIVERHGGQFH